MFTLLKTENSALIGIYFRCLEGYPLQVRHKDLEPKRYPCFTLGCCAAKVIAEER